ncbi:MAG: benzoate/H(+) symporter BenE family transporter [Pseudomonadota bacterium]
MKQFFHDVSWPAASAGFVAVLVGFTSSVAIVFQAAVALRATPAQLVSWVAALGLGMGLCTLLPSLWWRKPVMVAWSTPGAAVVATAATAAPHTMAEGVGAFMVCAALILVVGVTGWFEHGMRRMPMSLANALLAGVLARFAMNTFVSLHTALPLVLLMCGAYLLGRRIWPAYTVLGVLLVGCLYTGATGGFQVRAWAMPSGWPTPVMPVFQWSAIVNLALPLFLVTMASQNLPGAAAIRAAGYQLPLSKLVALTGLATLLLAPWGAFALCLSAITAALCMSPAAHENPDKRYTAAACCGLIYCLVGAFSAPITAALLALPPELVAAVAGLALLGTVGNALHSAVRDPAHREAAVVTFVVTLSGLSLAGVGSAFWGMVAGGLTLFVQQWRRQVPVTAPPASPPPPPSTPSSSSAP